MAKTTKKQEIETLQKLSNLKDQRMTALENGDAELAAKLKAEIAALENGNTTVSTSSVDLEKVNVDFAHLGEIYKQVTSDIYRSNHKSLKKVTEAGKTTESLGVYTQFADFFYGFFLRAVCVGALFNGKGVTMYQYNLIKAKCFDNVKNEDIFKDELLEVFKSTERKAIDDFLKLSKMSKGFDWADNVVTNILKLVRVEEPKTEEPKTEEPKTEEPKTEEPKTEEPKTEEPKTEEPKTEEPKTEEPKTDTEPKKGGKGKGKK